MSWLRKLMERRERRRQVSDAIRNGTLAQFHREQHGTFVADVEFHRNEELRPERLGPGADDIDHEDETRVDPWRPTRSLGPIPED